MNVLHYVHSEIVKINEVEDKSKLLVLEEGKPKHKDSTPDK